ncbi:hypothetical protein ONA92_27065 [Mycobacteroides salmoniphilum]
MTDRQPERPISVDDRAGRAIATDIDVPNFVREAVDAIRAERTRADS